MSQAIAKYPSVLMCFAIPAVPIDFKEESRFERSWYTESWHYFWLLLYLTFANATFKAASAP